MAAPTPPIPGPALSQKQRRAAQRKERRKRKRQALAQTRECGSNNGDTYTLEDEELNDEDDEGDNTAELERLRLHEEWLEKERLAQEEFRLKCEREEAAQKRKEEEERMIKEEWEAQQRREKEEKEQKRQEKQDRENQPSDSLTKDTHREKPFSSHNKDEAVQKMLDEAESQLDNRGPWMNPEAPAADNADNYGTERDVANCPFFLKTGACRFGERCSRKHAYPTSSPTLMIRGMFTTFGMEETRRDDYDIDAWLEHSEEELQESFLEFYRDVLPELKSVGKVVQFKVSCNYEPHLRGNVYIQFDTEEQCKEALIKFNGRWYAGRQLHCEICPVTRWKNAICGLFDRQKCPKGKHCNFLHVFRNPGNEFWEADRDLHLSPDRSLRGSNRDGRHSERFGDRSWRQRHCSRSPPRSERSHRREGGRWRSGSRERRDKWSSRSRHTDRRNDWYPSRNRSRSRSRDRESDRQRKRSRDKDKYRTRSEERDSKDKDTDSHRKREKSRSSSRERKRSKHSRDRSPKEHEENRETPNDGKTRRHHKQSKKSKKKSKKKHKKRSRSPEGVSSSGESDNEKESKGEMVEHLPATSPSQGAITEPVHKNNDLDEDCGVDSGKVCSSEVKSEHSYTEIESGPPETDDAFTS